MIILNSLYFSTVCRDISSFRFLPSPHLLYPLHFFCHLILLLYQVACMCTYRPFVCVYVYVHVCTCLYIVLMLRCKNISLSHLSCLQISFLLHFSLSVANIFSPPLFSVSVCSICSVWFNVARVGLLVGFLGWFINYLPYFFISPRYSMISL